MYVLFSVCFIHLFSLSHLPACAGVQPPPFRQSSLAGPGSGRSPLQHRSTQDIAFHIGTMRRRLGNERAVIAETHDAALWHHLKNG